MSTLAVLILKWWKLAALLAALAAYCPGCG